MPIPSHTCTSTTVPSPPRHLTITRVCDDGIELNWIPPREPNGDVRHYIIKYTTQDGTQQEINTANNINYYNLTGLEKGHAYNNITVVAVNSAGGGGGRQPITSYVHNSTVECTSELECKVLRIFSEYFFYIIMSLPIRVTGNYTISYNQHTISYNQHTISYNQHTYRRYFCIPQDTKGTPTVTHTQTYITVFTILCLIYCHRIIINLITRISKAHTWA